MSIASPERVSNTNVPRGAPVRASMAPGVEPMAGVGVTPGVNTAVGDSAVDPPIVADVDAGRPVRGSIAGGVTELGVTAAPGPTVLGGTTGAGVVAPPPTPLAPPEGVAVAAAPALPPPGPAGPAA